MNLQTIKSMNGQPEYVLLPVRVYLDMRHEIDAKLEDDSNEYVPFVLEDYVDSPAALARIRANVTQGELAAEMKVSQAYISKIEGQTKVTAKTLTKLHESLEKIKKV
tara:strand:+ start:7064 stop:7384 length:321 start_codon:yes stop_codon:yes gene_type:complete